MLKSNAENFENFNKNLIFIGKGFCRQHNCNLKILITRRWLHCKDKEREKEIIIVNGSYNEKSFSPERIDRKYALDLNFHKSAKVKTDFKESTFM